MQAILLGPPGAGKGTQAEMLCADEDLLHLSTGDLLRAAVAAGSELGLEAKGFMDRGELVPDSLVLALLKARLAMRDAAQGFLLDGFPRNLQQAEDLEKELGRDAVEHVIYLELGDEEILTRLLKRGRRDDTEDVIRNRLRVYRDETEPLVRHYRERGLLRPIDAMGSIESIFGRVRAAVGEEAGSR